MNPQDKQNINLTGNVTADKHLAALLSKAVRPTVNQTPNRDHQGNRKIITPNTYSFHAQLADRAKRNQDSQSILQLLPDLELAVQILTSSILSPSDMLNVELNITSEPDILTSEMSASLIESVRKYLEGDMNIKMQLPVMLRDIVAEKGCYPVAVIPENAIDELINGPRYNISKESMRNFISDDGITPKPVGILGPGVEQTLKPAVKKRLSLESIASVSDGTFNKNISMITPREVVVSDKYCSVTDNIMVLKFQGLFDKIRRNEIARNVSKSTKSFSLESDFHTKYVKKPSDAQIENQLYRDKNFNNDVVSGFKKQSNLPRRSIGKPLIMKFPSESVLPVHVPGDPKNHIAYFILIDDEGHPVKSDVKDTFQTAASKGFGNSARSSLSSSLIERVNINLGTGTNGFDPNKVEHLDYISRVYADMVEQDLIARVKNGVHSANVDLSKNEEFYRLMLSRTLQHKYTQLLYIPTDYMTYMAFKYNANGIGKSLLDDNSVINTLRTVLMFSNVMGAVKNSIGRTKVNVSIPEEDPDPVRTLEDAQEEIVRSRHLGLPFGGGWNPNDILEFLQRAGFEWNVQGGNLPDLKFDFENTSSSYPKADTDLEDGLRKHSIMGLGLSPEMVDNGLGSDFATVAVQNNILLTKRILQYQELFNPQLSDHCRKIILFSEDLITELRDKIKKNTNAIKIELSTEETSMLERYTNEESSDYKIDRALLEFIKKIDVCLPAPPSVSLEHQTDLVKTYADFLDTALDSAYINSDIVTDAMSGSVDKIKAQIKAFFLRKFMADKGIGIELGQLLATNENGGPQIDLIKEVATHAEALTRSCVANVAKLTPINNAAQSDMDKMGADSTSTSESSDSTDSGGGGEDDMFGDMGFDDDSGADGGSSEENGPPSTTDEQTPSAKDDGEEEAPAKPTL